MAAAFAAVAMTSAGVAHAAPSTQDNTFLADNEQTNLAEQSIGALAEQRSQLNQTTQLAEMTVTDHKTAQAKVTAVAKALAVTLPTTPNATQLAQAAQLKTVSAAAFDLAYAQIQVAGHQLSIASTQKEIASGSDPSVVAYATSYLPVARKHLEMAQAEVFALGGNPTGAPAGSAGAASSTSSSPRLGWEIGLGTGGAILLVAAALQLASRRRASST